MKKIFSIVVTYNGMEWIQRCLDSLMKTTTLSTVIVVDNGSTDETVSFIKNNYSNVWLHSLKKNIGFGQANNYGIQIALSNQADFLFLLNQDAYVDSDTIKTLLDFDFIQENIGILSPIHLNGKGTALDKYFYTYLQKSGITEHSETDILNFKYLPSCFEVEFVNAAAWMLSRQCVEKIGGFDPLFFHYGEDSNFAQRVKKLNLRIVVATHAIIFHDREDRIVKPKEAFSVQRDFTQFLVNAADINRPAALNFMFRKLARSTYELGKAVVLFDSKSIKYHRQMISRIIPAMIPVLRSRNLSTQKCPHLLL